MRESDVVVVGGGLAGSTSAAMLAEAGFDVVLVDPNEIYPPDLRCEKLDRWQVDRLRRTGLAERVLPAGTLIEEVWIARFGRVVEKRPDTQFGILYDTLVNAVRAVMPAEVEFVRAKVDAIDNSPDRQRVRLSTGREISARLVVLANGLNSNFRSATGMAREDVSKCHSVTIAFNVKPVGRDRFDFPALTYYPERTSDRFAYLTLFPVGSAMRANFMVYRAMDDPWLQEMRDRPDEALRAVMPGLEKIIGPSEVVGPVKIRPIDLYVTRDYLRPGIVLVGDAFANSCPAAGTGTGKVFTDVERLCRVYVPRWMRTEGMGVDKLADFYADPAKVACDRYSLDKAFSARSDSIDEGWSWRARRWIRFAGLLAIGTARRAIARRRLGPVRSLFG
jgi:2-polyprenyl-6-methoxyphenol hydroxylase-like FAD-dependent oxidoreductase